MKKGKILLVGVIALLLAGGLFLIGCDLLRCTNQGNCEFAVNDTIPNLLVCGTDGCAAKSLGNVTIVQPSPIGTGKPVKCDCM